MNSILYYNLINKIFKSFPYQTKQTILHFIQLANETNLSDTLISISELVKTYYSTTTITTTTDNNNNNNDENRHHFITTKLLHFLQLQAPNILNEELQIVDIGGGNGNILHNLNNYLNGNPTNYICVESAHSTNWLETYSYNHTNITYLFWDNETLLIPDKSIDCVLCVVALHHMSDTTIHILLNEINRILKMGGLLLIKEHDAIKSAIPFIHWEHYLYYLDDLASHKQIIEPSTYFQNYLSNYKTKYEWKRIIETNDSFQWIVTTNRFLDGAYQRDSKNASNLYWDLFKKTNTSLCNQPIIPHTT